ncbi:MAG TPA: hypothetical protein VNO75_12465 [Gemmatimonadaceae bacterium]|nr:hypothetical protein [Gemmatimonadaceae bacterium]
MDPTLFDQARAHFARPPRKRVEPEPTENLFDHVPKVSSTSPLLHQLVAIANELEAEHTRKHGPLYGVTIGEVIFEAEENRGLNVQPPPMEDKAKEQRAHSGLLARVLPHAGFARTASHRPSPVKRQHGNLHRVYVRREVKP